MRYRRDTVPFSPSGRQWERCAIPLRLGRRRTADGRQSLLLEIIIVRVAVTAKIERQEIIDPIIEPQIVFERRVSLAEGFSFFLPLGFQLLLHGLNLRASFAESCLGLEKVS